MKIGIKRNCIVCSKEYKTHIDGRRTQTCSKKCSKVYCRIQNSINSRIYRRDLKLKVNKLEVIK